MAQRKRRFENMMWKEENAGIFFFSHNILYSVSRDTIPSGMAVSQFKYNTLIVLEGILFSSVLKVPIVPN